MLFNHAEFEALDDFDMELEDTSFLDDVSVPTTEPGRRQFLPVYEL
jgi:hypothetical protein